jgi:hypothetical protein
LYVSRAPVTSARSERGIFSALPQNGSGKASRVPRSRHLSGRRPPDLQRAYAATEADYDLPHGWIGTVLIALAGEPLTIFELTAR